jgi:uncharacterized protein DUF6597
MDSPYREQAAEGSLARWVKCLWCVQSSQPIRGYPVRPDGGLDILYSRDEGLRVVGTMTAELRIDVPPDARTVGIRFRPGMAGTFLDAAPGELTDRILAAESLWGRKAREMAGRLDDARSTGETMRILLEGLHRPGAPNPVQRAMEAIAQAHGAVDLDWVACQANLSARQFRRRCLDEAGLTPKHLCNRGGWMARRLRRPRGVDLLPCFPSRRLVRGKAGRGSGGRCVETPQPGPAGAHWS